MTNPPPTKPASFMRATARPPGFVKPAHWTSEPAPPPAAPPLTAEALSPTRYGDWVRDGIAVDF